MLFWIHFSSEISHKWVNYHYFTILGKIFIDFFDIVCFHTNWNATTLSPSSECASCLMSCQTTLDLGGRLRKLNKISEILRFHSEYPAVHSIDKFHCVFVKNCKKSAVKHSMNKTVLLNFVNLSPAVRPRLPDEIYLHF